VSLKASLFSKKSVDPSGIIDVEHLPIPQLSPADEIQVRRALRRNRVLATGLLASPGWLVQLVRVGAEASYSFGLYWMPTSIPT
jgi:hypothetical protein